MKNKPAGVVYRFCEIKESKEEYLPPPYPFMLSEVVGRGYLAEEARRRHRKAVNIKEMAEEVKEEMYIRWKNGELSQNKLCLEYDLTISAVRRIIKEKIENEKNN